GAVTRRCQRVLRGRPVAVLTPGGELRFARPQRLERRAEPGRGFSLRRRTMAAPPSSTSHDPHRLLGFVDQIRRTPAWDERPDTEVVGIPFAGSEPAGVPARPAYRADVPAGPAPAAYPVDAPLEPPVPPTARPYTPPVRSAGPATELPRLASPAEL